MKFSRKDFLTRGAVAAGAMALAGKATAAETPAAPAAKGPPPPPPPSAIHFPVLRAADYDSKKFWETIKTKKEHKLIWQSVEPHLLIPGLSSLYVHIQNALNAGEFSYGWGKAHVASAAVLIGPSIAYSLNDAMWAKYPFGAAFKMNDASAKPETSNVYYKAQTNLSFEGEPGKPGNVYQDWSGEACIKRGCSFFVCHNALTAIAGLISMQTGGDPAATLADWKANMLPGYSLVPAGVGALHAAMDNGWKMLPLI